MIFRKFYQVYAPSIRRIISAESQNGEFVPIKQILSADFDQFKLGWSHYQILMRIQNEDERRFYEIEAATQQWTYEQLKRQYGSSLYELLALSRDKVHCKSGLRPSQLNSGRRKCGTR